MGSFSDYLEDEILDHVLKVGSYPVPSNIYIALSTADPLDDGSGISEPAGGAYARVQCNTWDAAALRTTRNTNSIGFPEATADWGNITHFAIFDAVSGGNMLGHGTFATPRYVALGQTYTIYAGDLEVSFNANGVSNYMAHAILDHVFKVSAYTPPTNIYVALSTGTITDAMSGDSISEPPSNYARVLHNSFNTASGGASSNNGAVTFAKATTEWGNIVDAALLDALTSGNLLWFGTLAVAQNLIIGDTVKFPDTDLDVTLD